jgi:hypothetical protein
MMIIQAMPVKTTLLLKKLLDDADANPLVFKGNPADEWPFGPPKPDTLKNVCRPKNPDGADLLPPPTRARLQPWQSGSFMGPCNKLADDPKQYRDILMELVKDGKMNMQAMRSLDGNRVRNNSTTLVCVCEGKHDPRGSNPNRPLAGLPSRESTTYKCECPWRIGVTAIFQPKWVSLAADPVRKT